MVFNFVTFDPENPVDFAALAPPTSPSTTSCDGTCTCTMTLVNGVLASASRVLTVPPINTSHARPRPISNPHDISVSDVISISDLRRFTFEELQAATYSFSDELVVGKGGFGVAYKGLLPDGSFACIKRSKDSSFYKREQFQVEVEIGSRVRHRNLAPAIGFCESKKEPKEYILVYPFKVNGDLRSRLKKFNSQPPLDWPTRKKILLGAARGLSYLHDNGIIHRDVKAANILLDENLQACIGDWGLAKFLDRREQEVLSPTSDVQDQNHNVLRFVAERNTASSNCYTEITTAVRGTAGHIAPEYLSTGRCSVTNDVYGFGVMIFEIVTAQSAFDLARMANYERACLIDWIKQLLIGNRMHSKGFIDPDLLGNSDEDDVKKTIQLGLACTLSNPLSRPSMLQVVQVLEGAHLKDIGTYTDYVMSERDQELWPSYGDRIVDTGTDTDYVMSERDQELLPSYGDRIVDIGTDADYVMIERDQELLPSYGDRIVYDSVAYLPSEELSGPR